MLLAEPSVALADWRAQFQESGPAADLARFLEHVRVDYLPHTVLVDCTASAAVAAHYAEWLAAGIHIVTPNKKANSGALAYYRRLQQARRTGGSHYLYEATVGAGLPVVQTLRDLRETGDEISEHRGHLLRHARLSVQRLRRQPRASPRSCTTRASAATPSRIRATTCRATDVARKLIILGREMGLALELNDVQVESLVPRELAGGSIEDFMAQPAALRRRRCARGSTAARARGKVLRYVGRITAAGEATVGLQELTAAHAFANIALTDNVVRFATRRYCDNPLIVQGPGAGPEVTAGGVFADLLRLAAYLGARL